MNLFELFVKIGVDDQASSKISKLSQGLGNGLKTAAKVGVAAVGAAAAGITALTKSAIDSYAQYEQLVGGVDTLFKNASQTVQQYAADAYKTAGMSANAYMNNVTAFSAALIGSLGGDTEAAAKVAHRAMVDMSDNANKMGTNIESIVLTYQSLSRGNFAMLDNLKLGYGGTKAELQRLIADAATYTDIQKEMGITVDATSTSFDNVINAISVVQKHLGIAGATALEAATTIEGSTLSMKAAWSNLVTGIADDEADFDTLMTNFVGSVENVAANLLPRVEIAFQGVGKLVTGLAPVITKALPTLIKGVVPSLVKSAVSLVKTLGKTLIDNVDILLDSAFDLGMTLVDEIIDFAPDLVEGVGTLIGKVVVGVVPKIPELLGSLSTALVGGVFSIVEEVGRALLGIPDAVGEVEAAIANKGHGFQSYAERVSGAVGVMEDISNLLTESGLTIAEIDEEYEATEANITRILSEAMQEQRELREEELEDIAEYNNRLAELLGQKLDTYAMQLQVEGTKLEINWAALDEAALVESQAKLDAYYDEAVSAAEDAYATELTLLKNRYAQSGQLGSEAYLKEEEELRRQHEQRIKDIEKYYAESIGLINQRYAELSAASSQGLFGYDVAKGKSWQSATAGGRVSDIPILGPVFDFFGISGWIEQTSAEIAGDIRGVNEEYLTVLNSINEGTYNSLMNTAATVKQAGGEIDESVREQLVLLLDFFGTVPLNLEDTAKESLLRIVAGMESQIPELKNASEMTVEEIVNVIRSRLLGGEFIGFLKIAQDNIEGVFGGVSDDAKIWGKDLVENYASGIKSRKSWLLDVVVGLANGIKDFIGFSEPEKGPLSNFHTYAPDMMELFAQGIRENENVVYNQLEKSFNFDSRLGGVGGSLSGGRSSGGRSVVVNMGGVTISVGSDVGDVDSLADRVSRRLYEEMERSMAVYG